MIKTRDIRTFIEHKWLGHGEWGNCEGREAIVQITMSFTNCVVKYGLDPGGSVHVGNH